jgi:kynureninase
MAPCVYRQPVISYEECAALDEGDPLADRRRLFDLDDDLVYLDGNSLGPPLRSITKRMGKLLDNWQSDLIAGWFEHGWAELPIRVGKKLEPIIGAERGSVVVCDSTSVNLFKAAMAACDLGEGSILTDSGNFPTDLYVLDEVARRRGRQLHVVEPHDVAAHIGPELALVSITQVDFRTGRLHDLGAITSKAHEAGALVVADLSHTAGVMPIELGRFHVDLAVGCGYKYLNGGPGAPGYLYAAPGVAGELRNPITGWFGHQNPFLFASEYVPAAGVSRMLTGTPHVMSMVALDEALAGFDGVDLRQVRTKSVALTGLFIDLVDQMLSDRVEVVTSRDSLSRGSQVTLRHQDAGAIIKELAGLRVVADFRPPGMMRFGFAPLFNRYTDAWSAASALAATLDMRLGT